MNSHRSPLSSLAVLLLVVLLQACTSIRLNGPITAEVVSSPTGVEVTLNGEVVGRAPLEIPLASFNEAVGLSTTQDTPPIMERRVSVLSPDRIKVSILLSDSPSSLAQMLGLSRVVVFDYNEYTSFDLNKYDLKPSFLPLLKRQTATLRTHFAGVDLYLCGHSDSTGEEDFNRLLSVQRAQSVADYLISKGLDRSSIHVQGFGSDFPIGDNSSKEGRTINRRTEIVLPD